MLTSSNVSNNDPNDGRADFETECVVDPSSGGFFRSDFKKHDDLKEMLESNKDGHKLEAMKRIIGMVAKGRDVSTLFPAVVKNVVSKNIEVKKLVYVYLERYAEEQQDLALLSISTFQRALKEPNQLIRAGALRVLSSIRVKMISPIVLLAIKEASADMSPYVRKTAAHAIPKLYSLDNELKSELVAIIQKFLADKTVLVIGSAVMAFTEVCPERVDLIHQVYRKLCALLIDVDEWGQVTIINMLTRYARMQFADPNLNEYGADSDSDTSVKPVPTLDLDHKLLLRSARPLLQSRNAAVVMAVAQLYHHAAPKSESRFAAKALVRLLRSHFEVQSVVLNSIASLSAQNKEMFEVYLKSFYVRAFDPTNIKLLKLEILTNLVSRSNISTILKELQTYVSNGDKKFVGATIQAIGKCACSINEVADSCLNGLVSLLSNRDEAVVAECVIVIKKLLQTKVADPKEIITQMARLLDSITVAQARAAILWLVGEHSQKVLNIAPDILRKLAKTFPDEHDIVKLQVMNLAVKLYITNSYQTVLLCQYIFNLARYDQNYDIRDRARLLKQFVSRPGGNITSQSARIFLRSKPAPSFQSQFKNREEFQLGSLSHYIKQKASGYEALPSFPNLPPPSDVRNVKPEDSESYSGEDTYLLESNSSSGSEETTSTSESSCDESESQSEEESSSIEQSSTSESSKDSSDEECEEEKEDKEAKSLNTSPPNPNSSRTDNSIAITSPSDGALAPCSTTNVEEAQDVLDQNAHNFFLHHRGEGTMNAIVSHPLYTTNLASSDCHRFPKLKDWLRSKKYQSDENVKSVVCQ